MGKKVARVEPILRYRKRLEELFEKAKVVSDDELRSEWAKYLCVLASGFLEVSVVHIINEFSRLYADPRVAKLVSASLERMPNPWYKNIAGLVKNLDEKWKKSLDEFALGQREDAVNSIVRNRNIIAHGESSTVDLTQLKKWWSSADEVVAFIATLCLPS